MFYQRKELSKTGRRGTVESSMPSPQPHPIDFSQSKCSGLMDRNYFTGSGLIQGPEGESFSYFPGPILTKSHCPCQ